MEEGTAIFLKSVKTICPNLTDDELSQFASKLSFKELKKKDVFIQSGKVQKAIGFIAKGLTRSFFIDDNGNEITVGFYAEGDYATHYPAFITQKPSHYTIQCLEPTTMVCLAFEDMQWVYQQLAGFERYGRLVAEEILKRQQSRIESFIFQTAEERYLDFIAHHPTLFNRVSLSQLCSFLGIERQTLTRIRQKLAH
ncbi:MAG: Crp/Fnr family transcriptional regulator [Chitinophagaceae bacterium]